MAISVAVKCCTVVEGCWFISDVTTRRAGETPGWGTGCCQDTVLPDEKMFGKCGIFPMFVD